MNGRRTAAGPENRAPSSDFASLQRTDREGRAYEIRAYRGADRIALERMYDEFEPKRVAQGLPPDGSVAITRWLDRTLRRGDHVVVVRDGTIVGHAMLVPTEEDETVELANFLHQAVRGRGIGTELNRTLVEFAAETGYARVWLSVELANRAAVRSYENVGFQRLPGSLWAPEIEMAVDLTPRRSHDLS